MRVFAVFLHGLGLFLSVAIFSVGVFGIINAVNNKAKLSWIDWNSKPNIKEWTQPLNIEFAAAEHAALLCFLGELNAGRVRNVFPFLGSLCHIGIFYILYASVTFLTSRVGVFSLGIAGNWGILVGCAAAVGGVIMISCGLLCSSHLGLNDGYSRIN